MAAYLPHIRKLPIYEIKDILRGRLQIPRSHEHPKEQLLQWVTQNATAEILEELQARMLAIELERGRRKRTREVERRSERRQRTRRETTHGVGMSPVDVSKYLDLPTDQQVNGCYRDFYHATSKAALEQAVCGVCARERQVKQDGVVPVPLAELPVEKLAPVTSHPAQVLTSGMLLERSGIVFEGDLATNVLVCHECSSALSRSGTHPPQFSLANDLWIGPIPWELQRLTLPEQQLIALLYPRVYVVKLYPKDKDYRPEEQMLQRAMRGNVTTYPLDKSGVASMVEGRLMPRPASVLSSLIAITFIGRGQLPKRCLRNSFRVRRDAVRRALLWLKANNPKYYGDIDISEERLQALPEDDVPEEITAVVRQSTDLSVIDEESAGYVPQDVVDNNDGAYLGPSLSVHAGSQICVDIVLPEGISLEDLQVESGT
ncbi:hypothetical protein PsYK624_164330 [Phanerochaete sordida]|uniref:DUF6570 domain-containing protein n=1 Tax=Phanerochaete sordida TaxID=48140 RepID=A0A9P3LLV5_9APHY|nr:hypothetical protein PsYK624_164330 [Phanerochaete sordida]